LIVIVVATCIITTGFIALLQFNKDNDEKTKEEVETQIFDNRISPLENQGVIFDIIRLRHRGFLNELMSFGNSWRNSPKYYFVTNMDGLEYVSKDVGGGTTGKSVETFFEVWDTIFMENKICRDVEEENVTADISLSIFEHKKTGLLGIRSNNIEKEKIKITYDFRTGKWKGDDFLGDEDGLGHYVGETFEIWFNVYQVDYDFDNIPYWAEVNLLGTDPHVDDSQLDPDEDGIPTSWEYKWGYDPFTWDDHRNLDPDVDGIENIEEYQIRKWFSDPFSPDIYLEADGMEKNGLFDPAHIFWKESQQALIERFCQHNINLYIDDGWIEGPRNGGGELLTHYERISQDSGMFQQFYDHHFADERKGIFRYAVVSHSSGFCHPQEGNKYDIVTAGTDLKKLIFKRQAFTPRTQRIALAAGIMHELGHSLGIAPWTHEGCDNFSYSVLSNRQHYKETWGNYVSVMNYFYIWDKSVLDYSDGSNGAPYDTNDWEHIYLPSFQIQSNVIEDPSFDVPGKDAIVDENLQLELKGWELDENLTQRFNGQEIVISTFNRINGDFFVMKKIDGEQNSENDIRIYLKPNVYPTYAEWSLISEGKLGKEGDIQFYSIQNEFDNVLEKINEMENIQ